jgi:hypothetical protein
MRDRNLPAAVVGKPTRYGELVAVVVALALWLVMLIGGGPKVGLEGAWLPLIAMPLGVWTIGMRLRVTPTEVSRSFGIGPIGRRSADLQTLRRIHWKQTGSRLSGGTILVEDEAGHVVPIYANRFTRIEQWGPMLLAAATRSGAQVDTHSRKLLSAQESAPW